LEHGLQRFRHWINADVFTRIFDAVSGDPDIEFVMIDGTIVKIHWHCQGAKGDSKPASRRALFRRKSWLLRTRWTIWCASNELLLGHRYEV